MVIEHAQAQGVTPFVVIPSIVCEKSRALSLDLLTGEQDGRGTGAWNQLSVMIPGLTRASLKLGKVYKFDENIVSPLISFNFEG